MTWVSGRCVGTLVAAIMTVSAIEDPVSDQLRAVGLPTTMIFGELILGGDTTGSTADDAESIKCFGGLSQFLQLSSPYSMKECCFADKFGNCVAGAASGLGDGAFMGNVLANAGFSVETGMMNWKQHDETGLCVQCCDATRAEYPFYESFRLVCPKQRSTEAFNVFQGEQKAGESCDDGISNNNEDGVDCNYENAGCNDGGTRAECCSADDTATSCLCVHQCNPNANTLPVCGGPNNYRIEATFNRERGKCYRYHETITKNYPGCPPGSAGDKCDIRVPCPNGADNQGCTGDCWPKELDDKNQLNPGVCKTCKAGSSTNANDIPIWNYKTEQWDCGPEDSKFTLATASASTAGGSYEFRFARRQNQGDTVVVSCKLEYDPARLGMMVGYDLVLQVQEYNEGGQFWVGVNGCRAFPIFQGDVDDTITALEREQIQSQTYHKSANDRASWEQTKTDTTGIDSLVQRIHITNLTPECNNGGGWKWNQGDWQLFVEPHWFFPIESTKIKSERTEDRVESPVYDNGATDISNPLWSSENFCASPRA